MSHTLKQDLESMKDEIGALLFSIQKCAYDLKHNWAFSHFWVYF